MKSYPTTKFAMKAPPPDGAERSWLLHSAENAAGQSSQFRHQSFGTEASYAISGLLSNLPQRQICRIRHAHVHQDFESLHRDRYQ